MAVIHASDPIHAADEIAGIHENHVIGGLLGEVARLLSDQRASDFRVRAYHAAATTISELKQPVRDLLDHDGLDGLIALPTIGQSIANLIDQYIRLKRMPLLDRLCGEATAEQYFTTLPGIGPELSHRIHDHLHVETLPELYAAAKQGRLTQVPGLGRKRIRAIEDNLSRRIEDKHLSPTSSYPDPDRSVPIAELLNIDSEYRDLASRNQLAKVAPRRFNPGRLAWLPILHTDRGGRHYTALYSNTARAHELNTTHDWVVIYRDDANSHGRWTTITAQFGKLHGCRIVRGREDECETYYRHQSNPGNGEE